MSLNTKISISSASPDLPISGTPGQHRPLWTESQTAVFLAKSPKTLRNGRVKRSPIPFYKIGRSVRYRPEEVAAYVEAQRRQSTSDEGAE